MIKDIVDQIQNHTIEALGFAKTLQEVTSEAFIVQTSINKRLNRATVSVFATKRPFPINKFILARRAIGGQFWKARTLAHFTMLKQVRHSFPVQLLIKFYMRECLNPASWDKVQVQQGVRGKVLTPDQCDGAEFAIMRGLNVQNKPAEAE